MRNFLPILLFFSLLISCAKDKEFVSENKISDTAKIEKTDSVQIPNIQNPEMVEVFEINTLDVSSGKAKAVFSKEGKTLFYFDQNSNKGKIRIDGKDYELISYDFNEDNYTLSGNEVKIEATNGDFKDQSGDCMEGTFPEVRVTLNGKTLSVPNVGLKDCPDY